MANSDTKQISLKQTDAHLYHSDHEIAHVDTIRYDKTIKTKYVYWHALSMVQTTRAALAANPWPLQTHLSCPACIALGNFILEFPSINSWSRLFSGARMRQRENRRVYARKFQNEITGAMHAGQERSVWRGRHLQCWEMPARYLGYLYIDLWCKRYNATSTSTKKNHEKRT